MYPLPITPEDVAVWPYSVDILLEFSSFLASLHWPQGASDSGKFGISYFELLLMFEIFAGHRLLTAATELFNGTLKLRYSSIPFSKKLPSWSVSGLSGYLQMVSPGPGPSVHFPDHDPVLERPAKRLRITGKSSALRREPFSGDGLPTPKRWKRLVPKGTESLRIEDAVPPFLFSRTGVG